MPVKTLKKVVLPAPLGPMMEAIRPSSSTKSTPFRAVSPPKRFETPRASRSTVTARAPPPARGRPWETRGRGPSFARAGHEPVVGQRGSAVLELARLALGRQDALRAE